MAARCPRPCRLLKLNYFSVVEHCRSDENPDAWQLARDMADDYTTTAEREELLHEFGPAQEHGRSRVRRPKVGQEVRTACYSWHRYSSPKVLLGTRTRLAKFNSSRIVQDSFGPAGAFGKAARQRVLQRVTRKLHAQYAISSADQDNIAAKKGMEDQDGRLQGEQERLTVAQPVSASDNASPQPQGKCC